MRSLVTLTASTIFVLLLSDMALFLLGFPSEVPRRVTHPENYRELRQTIDFEHVFETNSDGLRYSEIRPDKGSNEYRILLLGDSFTEGNGVELRDSFGAVLERHFEGAAGNRTSAFINGGLSGTGPLAYLKLFSHVGSRYELDGVLICLFANDVSNSPEHFEVDQLDARNRKRPGLKRLLHQAVPRIYTLAAVARSGERLRARSQTTDFVQDVSKFAAAQGLDPAAIKSWERGLSPDLVRATNQGRFNGSHLSTGLLNPHYWTDAIDIDREVAERKYTSMLRILEELVQRVRAQGIPVGVVFIPAGLQYDLKRHSRSNPWIQGGCLVRRSWLYGEAEIQRRLRAWTERIQVPFLDLTTVMRQAVESGTAVQFRYDTHWTPAGHLVAGYAIASWLESNNLFALGQR